MRAYHGSSEKIDKFVLDFVGSGDGTTGAGYGVYFASLKSEALLYGLNIHTVNLKLRKALSNTKLTLTAKNVGEIISKTSYWMNYDERLTPTLVRNIANDLVASTETDTDMIGEFINAGEDIHDIMEIIVGMGYTHTVDAETSAVGDTHYIMYDMDAIEIIDVKHLDEI